MGNGKKAGGAILGVDLGGTKILVGVFDERLKLLGRVKAGVKTETGVEAVTARMFEAAREAADKAGVDWKRLAAVGLGAPSPIEPGSGKVIFAPNLGWRDVPLQDMLKERFKVPVFVGNDCNLATLGIHQAEFYGKPKHMIGIFLGTGIGGGLILEGRLFTGFNGTAGEFGQMTLDYGGVLGPDNIPGSLEATASRAALSTQIRAAVESGQKTALTEISRPDLREIKSGQLRKAIERGDTFVESLVCRAAERVGVAIGSLINIINPEVVVLGGGMIEQLESRMLPIIRAKALEYSDAGVNRGVRIVTSRLADDAGIVGAAAFAKKSLRAG